MDVKPSVRVNPVLESCAQLLLLVSPLRGPREKQQQLPDDYRARVTNGFDVLERMAQQRQVAGGDIDEAKYALAALIDECVMASEWPGRGEWMARPLQAELFGEHLAGQGFYRRLERLRQNPERNRDLLELYYACLQFGFEGIYKMQGLEKLLALQDSLRSTLESLEKNRERTLAPGAAVDRSLLAKIGRTLPYRVIGVATMTAIVLMYAGFAAVTHYETERSYEALLQNMSTAKDRAIDVGGGR